jgi:hypothetical protein
LILGLVLKELTVSNSTILIKDQEGLRQSCLELFEQNNFAMVIRGALAG